ncbi:unnamed protein product [Prorocentrum cordatum]|uniref:Reverse transcriptase domain-containing protein n=1 Tax=Prorocentrum cordatum TaxID=2364126 RepID=A0ABN9STG0_9DINO|nr:unnamed protein product [Polarella glacialis]
MFGDRPNPDATRLARALMSMGGGALAEIQECTALQEKLTEFEVRSSLSVKVRAVSASGGDRAFAVGQGAKWRAIFGGARKTSCRGDDCRWLALARAATRSGRARGLRRQGGEHVERRAPGRNENFAAAAPVGHPGHAGPSAPALRGDRKVVDHWSVISHGKASPAKFIAQADEASLNERKIACLTPGCRPKPGKIWSRGVAVQGSPVNVFSRCARLQRQRYREQEVRAEAVGEKRSGGQLPPASDRRARGRHIAEFQNRKAGAVAVTAQTTCRSPQAKVGAVSLPCLALPGNLLGLPVQVRHKQKSLPLLGIIDTSSMYSVINWQAARELGIASGPADAKLGNAAKAAAWDAEAEWELLKQAIRTVSDRMAAGRDRAGVAPPEVDDKVGLMMRFVQAHAVGLAREAAVGQLAELSGAAAADPTRDHRRDRLFQMLRRLSPGRPTSLPAVRNARGEVVTDPEGDVQAALDSSPDSAPGPDGIPFLSWRLLGPLAVDVLFKVLQRVATDPGSPALDDFLRGSDVSTGFNRSLKVFLPKEFSRIFGFRLNLPKTVIVPLSLQDATLLARFVSERFTAWAGIKVELHAMYLGFVLGPERGDLAITKPLKKFLERVRDWGAAGGGLLLTALAYSVYIIPVIAFLLQLDNLPPAWGQTEAPALRTLVPGLEFWCIPADLRNLRGLGFPKDSPDAARLSLACRFRVARREGLPDGLRVAERSRELRLRMRDAEHLDRIARWSSWFQRSFVFHLEAAAAHLAASGVRPDALEGELARGEPRPYCSSAAAAVRRGLQRAALAALPRGVQSRMERRTRYKLTVRNVSQFPRCRAERCLAVLRELGARVTPRTWAAHYAACPAARRFAQTWLGLHRPGPRQDCTSCFLLLDMPLRRVTAEPGLLVRKALRTAAVCKRARRCPSAFASSLGGILSPSEP